MQELTLCKFIELYSGTTNIFSDGGGHSRKLAFAGMFGSILVDQMLAGFRRFCCEGGPRGDGIDASTELVCAVLDWHASVESIACVTRFM